MQRIRSDHFNFTQLVLWQHFLQIYFSGIMMVFLHMFTFMNLMVKSGFVLFVWIKQLNKEREKKKKIEAALEISALESQVQTGCKVMLSLL